MCCLRQFAYNHKRNKLAAALAAGSFAGRCYSVAVAQKTCKSGSSFLLLTPFQFTTDIKKNNIQNKILHVDFTLECFNKIHKK